MAVVWEYNALLRNASEEIRLEAVNPDAMFLKLSGVKGEEKRPMGWVVVTYFLFLKACLQSFELDRTLGLL